MAVQHGTGGLPQQWHITKQSSNFSFRLPHVLTLQTISFRVGTMIAQMLHAQKGIRNAQLL